MTDKRVPNWLGPLVTTSLIFGIVVGAILHSKGIVDLRVAGDLLQPAAAAVGSLGLSGVQWVTLLIGSAFVVGGLHSLYKGLPAFPTSARVLLSNPDVDAAQVPTAGGAVELSGTAEVHDEAGTVQAPYTGTEALAYTYEKTRTERRTTGSRSGQTTTRTVEKGEEGHPFRLVDDSGEVLVHAPEADVSLDVTHTGGGADTTEKEGVLEPGDDVYVRGHARDGTGDPDLPGGPYVGAGDGPFIVSDASERWTGLRYGTKAVVLTGFGLVLVAVGLALLLYTGTLEQLVSGLV
jgi:hypothetical protein